MLSVCCLYTDKGPSSQSYGFSSSYVYVRVVRVGLKRKLRADELILLNCGVGEES